MNYPSQAVIVASSCRDFEMALGGFARLSGILHFAFFIRPGVALGGFGETKSDTTVSFAAWLMVATLDPEESGWPETRLRLAGGLNMPLLTE
ncbi:MAG: hypothetical protein ACLQU3_07040 [Limisphaerales bacterium]